MTTSSKTVCARFEDVAEDLPADAMILADPPWGISYRSNHNTRKEHREEWQSAVRDANFAPITGDDKPFDPAPLLRFEKVAIFGGNYCADKLPPSRCWIAWDKKLGKSDQSADMELVWTNFNKPCRIFSHLWRGICRAGEENVSKGPKLHPHQKPVDLLRRIIEYSGHRGLVIDPYCGSGSVSRACHDLGLDCLSFDCELAWCRVTQKQLKMRQIPLPRTA